MIKVYTDGSCLGNPGPGASAFLVVKDGRIVASDVKTYEETTNNRAEVEAAIMGIQYAIKHELEECQLFSDSKYVVDGINKWMHKWASNGWHGYNKQQIKTYTDDILPQTEEVYRTAIKSYDAGELSYLEYMQVKQLVINARENYITALFNT